MSSISAIPGNSKLLASVLAGGFVFSVSVSQADVETPAAAAAVYMALAQTGSPSTPSGSPAEWQARKGLYYKRNWGVEIIGVKPVSSGYMLEFRYRILDPDKAKLLNDRKARAYIIDEASGIRLAVPAMENIGELRSDAAPETNRTYFMIFGNPGKVVKPGSRVSVVVGNFRVDGLIVN